MTQQQHDKLPSIKSPELAKTSTKIPNGDQWLHEIKFDGYRLLAYLDQKKITLKTRKDLNWTNKFPELAKALSKLKVENAILDGEVVVIDDQQHSNFQLLQTALSEKLTHTIVYYVFDLLYLNNKNLMSLPLLERKTLLKEILVSNPYIHYSDHIIGHGEEIFDKTCSLGLEGIISKRINSKYEQRRSHNWLKSKCANRQEFIVIGYTNPAGSREYFGSLLIAYYDQTNHLKYCGHVGTGFSRKSLKEMHAILKKNEILTPPIQNIPRKLKGAHWVKPNIIVEVEFKEWTRDDLIRQPSFKGIRMDKIPKKVIMEPSKKQSRSKIINKSHKTHKTYPITHPERILYPEQNITKQMLAEYYDKVSDLILPHIRCRPLVLVRCPQGYQNECFFQKHLNIDLPHIYHIPIKEKSHIENYPYIKNKAGLIALVQLNVLEIHIWGCHIDKIEQPDIITFDLDPAESVPWSKVIHTALMIRDELKKLKLQSFIKTTGGKGLHVIVPTKRLLNWRDTFAFAEAFTQYIVAKNPKDYIATSSKAKRSGKIFIDYFRNHRGATIIAPYSTRARAGATISMPMNWRDVNTKIKSNTFTIIDLLADNNDNKQMKKNPWPNYFTTKQSLPKSGTKSGK